MRVLPKKSQQLIPSNVLLAFIHSWELHGNDEVSICSSTLDLLRAYLGERPCCLWKWNGTSLSKTSERGMVDMFMGPDAAAHQAVFNRAIVSGIAEYDPCEMDSLVSELKFELNGFLHVPIKIKDRVLGLLSVAVEKKEARDRDFVQPLESLSRLVGIALHFGENQEANTHRERKLKAEVDSTTRELEQTNKALIDRVKELKMLYQELQKRVQELTAANKAKDEFLSIVSHELRTPLTSLTGFLSVLLDEDAGPITEQQRKFLGIAKASAGRLNLIISDLLDISRIESGRINLNMGDCSMYEILNTSVEGLRSSADKKNLKLELHASVDLPVLWGDSSRLQQVIDNLISNAVKFTDAGGSIDVYGEEKGDFVQVQVKDTGPGLSPEEQSKVFDMFYQADASTRRPAGGAGLGLAIARGIVMMHGGQISVNSEKGHGATFLFVVPRKKIQKAA